MFFQVKIRISSKKSRENLNSPFNLKLKSEAMEKAFVDEIRCLNGKLEIVIHMPI
mgnify:CR=1 FL=1